MIFSEQLLEAAKRGEAVRLFTDDVELVVMRADLYDRVQKVLEEDLTHDDLRAILARSYEASDWNDPQMDIYDEYDKYRK